MAVEKVYQQFQHLFLGDAIGHLVSLLCHILEILYCKESKFFGLLIEYFIKITQTLCEF
jgi:hypothetical protein